MNAKNRLKRGLKQKEKVTKVVDQKHHGMGLIINKFNKQANKKDKNLKMITNRFMPRDTSNEQNLAGQIGEAAKKIEDTAKLKEIDEVTEKTESDEELEPMPQPNDEKMGSISHSPKSGSPRATELGTSVMTASAIRPQGLGDTTPSRLKKKKSLLDSSAELKSMSDLELINNSMQMQKKKSNNYPMFPE